MAIQFNYPRWFKEGLMLVLALAFIYFTPYFIAHVSAANYYVSQSGGSDSSATPSSSATPYKTIAKLNTITFAAGDTIYLKAGDTWVESFIAKGTGSSNNWITVESYGSGNKPVLSPGTSAAYAVQMQTSNAGWRFRNLSINGAQAGISFLNTGGNPDGLWIENVDFTDITNAPVYPSTNASIPGMPYSNAIDIRETTGVNYLTNVTIRKVNVTYSDAAMDLRVVNGLTIDGLVSDHTYREGVTIESTINGLLKNMKITYAAYRDGMAWGTTGLQFNACSNIKVMDSEIAYTQKPNSSPDGIGLDFEANNVNVSAQRLYMHDNQGSAYLVYRNTSWGTDSAQTKTDITDNLIVNNGLYDSNTSSFLRVYENHYNTGIINGNIIIKANSGQTLNFLSDASPQNTSLYPVSAAYAGYQFTASNNAILTGGTNYFVTISDFGSTANTGGSSCTAGSNCWSYQLYNGSSYSSLGYDSTNQWWGSSTGYVSRYDELPNSTSSNWLARVWTAPSTGTVSIRGGVFKSAIGGDGVKAKITKNGTVIWPTGGTPQTIAYNDQTGYTTNLDSISVSAGDIIRFEINNGGSGSSTSDLTSWSPYLAYTALSGGGSSYQASTGFSSTQGANNWAYQYWNGSSYTNMTWDSGNSRWNKSGSYSIVSGGWQHPDSSADSVRKFTAPQAGNITITGTVKKNDTTGGDGVNVKILKNGTQIWPAIGWQAIAYNDATGYSVSVNTSVATNDAIYFIVNQNGGNGNDATAWDPLITYTGNSYQASTGFSSTQGTNNWSYSYWNGSAYTSMTWDLGNSRWNKSGSISIVSGGWQHPDNSADSVRKFTSPQAGTITITGTVKKGDTSGGDGVQVKIIKNGTQIWPASGWQAIAFNDGTGYSLNVSTSVAVNDAIYFIVNQNGNHDNDNTLWDPVISY
ncbi:hypothetical protein EHS13_05840 [Paenibacillus psychroresistens]|uniref:Right-handed parallel beta-helix repeat-containing protein n=1 Tax=Paenibacillus psychroresistens TaxID=1778678 RepID=A0A6B8REU5_9BACL|nr:hypothetical protein [Paenibacillus psychroresistens]QGQ94457.1 hypothetical protein EHS13_05840 [Paenibacillus psychroresistens]